MSTILTLCLFGCALATAGEDPAVQRDAPLEVMPARTWDFTHLQLNLRVDPKAGAVSGTATHTIKPLAASHSKVRLHQAHLDIERVWVDDKEVDSYRTLDGLLDIPVAPGVPHTVRVQYRATPQTGLHFRNPKGSADSIEEVWSQGEGEDNRHWFPGWDYPNDRFTFSGQFTAPDHLHVVSNGTLSSTQPAEKGWKTWSYDLEHELVNYLVMLAIGEYAIHREEGAVPLEYIVAKDVPRDVAINSFGDAKPQLDYFNKLLGANYPYPIYRQVAVQRFMYGGMENTTATVMSDDLLLRLPTDSPYRSEAVTAHELAHQWFGDWLTCYGWRELWLNEGFASYYTMRWMEQAHGPEYSATKLHGSLRSAARGKQPMSPISHTKMGESENAAVYTQGLSVLHSLSVFLGRDTFDKGIAHYVATYQDELVESSHLRRAMEDTSGHHLGWLFDQWVTGRGTPHFETKYSVEPSNEDTGTQVVVEIKQTTKGTAFHAPVEVEIGTTTGVLTRKIWVHEGTTKLVVDVPDAPQWVVVDPQGGLIANWKRKQKVGNWVNALAHSPTPFVRLIALTQFGEDKTSDEAVTRLRETLLEEKTHSHLRGFAADALGRIATPDAVTGLLDGTRDPSPHVRSRSLRALGKTPSKPQVIKALRKAFRSDKTPWVRATALEALDKLDKEASLHASRVFLNQPVSLQRQEVARSAISLLGRRGAVQDVETLLALVSPKTSGNLRKSAAWSLTTLIGRLDDEVRKKQYSVVSRPIERMLVDPDIRTRQTGVQVLGYLGDANAAKRLRAFASACHIKGDRTSALNAANQIRNRKDKPTKEEREADLKRLEEKIEALEKRLKEVERWR